MPENPPSDDHRSSVDQDELARFAAQADAWRDPAGAFRQLHKLNPTRLRYVRDRLADHFERDIGKPKPFAGLRVLDIGCGGGLACEPMARLGADVVGIDAAARRVIVGPQSALACHRVGLSEASWVSPDGGPVAGTAVLARLRNTAPALPATIVSVDGDRVTLTLDAPQYGISTGQAAVLYDASNPDRVLGGGWITDAPTAGAEAARPAH